VGLSFRDVAAQQGASGRFDGWRFATVAEVQGIVTQVGLPLVAIADRQQLDLRPFDSFFGLTVRGLGAAYGFVGLVGGDSMPGRADYHPEFWGFTAGGLNTAVATDADAVVDETIGRYVYGECFTGAAEYIADGQMGSFLVREAVVAAVPEPSTWAVMLAGLLAGSGGLRRASGGRRTAA
jgi:hypothetical protein